MFSHLVPDSPLTFYVLCGCLILVLAFEFSNGFHDAANAVATVIYTNSLKPAVAVMLSGVMNFLGVLIGGIAVAYALVQILPPEVLSPPNANPAVGVLAALFLSGLVWNLGTWALAIPNSSSHALIGWLVGISIASALKGPLNRYACELMSLGFTQGEPTVPAPHTHHYRSELDHLARQLVGRFEWKRSPLRAEDQQ